MKFDIKKLLPHLVVFLVFVVASLAYFNPVLSGKKLYQNDIVQYKGNARQLIDYRADNGEELYWTDAVFGGMPTYQLGARYPHDYIDGLDRLIRFLPRPADYLFLYFSCFYILMLVLKVDWKLALLGALAFGFSTYLIIILGVGHNSKAHAIAYFPLVLSGILLVFQRKYVLGTIVTAISLALELQANHLQMTYYLMLAVIILGIAYLVDAIRKNEVTHYFKSVGLMLAAVVVAVCSNAGNLLATSEYSKESTRGVSNISITAQGENVIPTKGLGMDYVTEYSYGITESLNMIVPKFTGGGSGERPGEDSHTVEYLQKLGLAKSQAVDFVQSSIPMYWGDQPIVEAPAYLGVSVFFLAVLALFMIKGRLKWWTLGVIILAVLLSYGKNMEWLTSFFYNYIPLYNKFRAVSSILVLVELVVPILAVVGLYKFFSTGITIESKSRSLLYAGGIIGGLLVVFSIAGSSLFDFVSPIDRYFREDEQLGSAFVDAIREDRWILMRNDALRSLLIVGIICGLLYLTLKKKISSSMVTLSCAIVILVDLVSFNLNYVNADDYVNAREYDMALPRTPADELAAKDEGHFRVYDLLASPNNSARASAFNKALGGYHGAKPARFQDLADFYLYGPEGNPAVRKENIEILSMFNVRYILDQNEEGVYAKKNPLAMGNAWFVNEVEIVADQNVEIQALARLKGDTVAFITRNQAQYIGIDKKDAATNSQITLTDYDPQKLVYQATSESGGLAVFSEMYYPHGWIATIDGQEAPIAKVNYVLRGLKIPKGTHEVVFRFEPEVVRTGSTVMLISNIVLLLAVLGGVYLYYRKKKRLV
ncbi:MAG: YfhO family protein [Nonlabens sp.]